MIGFGVLGLRYKKDNARRVVDIPYLAKPSLCSFSNLPYAKGRVPYLMHETSKLGLSTLT